MVSFVVPHTAKRHKKVRECSVSIIFVCFVVKKADGLRTPCGKYTVFKINLVFSDFKIFICFDMFLWKKPGFSRRPFFAPHSGTLPEKWEYAPLKDGKI